MNNILIFKRIDEEKKDNLTKLDRKDQKILSVLVEDSRLPISQLKKKVGLSRDTVQYRMEKLKQKNIILAYVPVLNFKNFGYQDFHVFLAIDESVRDRKDSFITSMKKRPYVRKLMEYSDRFDIELVILAQDIYDFDDKISQIANDFPETILEKEKLIVLKGYYSSRIPKSFQRQAGILPAVIYKPEKPLQLDRIDYKILRALCNDGRIPYHAIAQELSITGEAVSYRIRRLEEHNVIRKFSCMINLSSLGYHWYSYLLKVKRFDAALEKKMMRFIEGSENILRAVKTMGSWDFVFYILAKDHRQYHDTVNRIKYYFSDIIQDQETLLAYKEHFYKPMPWLLRKNNTKEE